MYKGLDIKAFVSEYGYWAVFLGSLIEGESIILVASVLAAMGILSIYKVALIAFGGTLVADQGLYILGYYYGQKVLDRIRKSFPRMSPYLDKAHKMINRYDTIYILVFRFIYGIRIISPIVIGSHRVSFKKFSFLNIVSAALWAVVSCALGYSLGEWLERQGPVIQILVISLVSMGFGGWLVWSFFASRRRDKVKKDTDSFRGTIEKSHEKNSVDRESEEDFNSGG
jgi:membrane protein DedA with SNARE-associated domain